LKKGVEDIEMKTIYNDSDLETLYKKIDNLMEENGVVK